MKTMSQAFQQRLFPNLPVLAMQYGTPMHVIDEIGIREQVRYMYRTMQEAGFIDFKNYYAAKALPWGNVLKILHEEGCGFDCSSEAELVLARRVGAMSDEIMFTSNDTTSHEFEVADAEGGSIINLDDRSFISHPYFRKNGFPKQMCVRINPGPLRKDDTVIGKPESAKYGIKIEEVLDTYELLDDMGVEEFGIHTMIASGDRNYTHLVTTVQMMADVALKLLEKGFDVKFINIGGGVGIPYHPSDANFDFTAFAKESAEVFRKTFGPMEDAPRLVMECGRWITGPHGVFVTRAINRKEIYETHVGVEMAMGGNPRPAVYGAYHHISVVDNNGKLVLAKNRGTEIVNVVGPICENCDRLATQVRLPRILHGEDLGDFIVSHSCGAHAPPMASNYNTRPRPGGVLLKSDGTFELAYRPESISELFARDPFMTSP